MLKKAGSRFIAKKTSTIAGKRVFKIYVFLTSKGVHYRQTIQTFGRRLYQHKNAGKKLLKELKKS